MIVQLQRVVFDHDAKATIDGLSLRVDRVTPAQDWMRGATDPSPAAYAIAATDGQPLTIQAQFSFPDTVGFPGSKVSIRARPENPDTAPFGLVGPAVVTIPVPTIATPVTPPVSLPLSQVRFVDRGVGRYDVTLRWQVQIETDAQWLDFDSSDHVIYLTLDVPGLPWTQGTAAAGDPLRWPWTRVLDWSCTWASGITIENGDLDAAIVAVSQRIESSLYALGQRFPVPVTYDGAAGAGSAGGAAVGAYAVSYDGLVAFLCTKFLSLLAGDTAPEIETQINCSDCAAALVVFANVLGCDLASKRIVGPGGPDKTFQTNQVVAIGRAPTNPRGYGFGYHEVTGRGHGFHVYDACLMIDRDADPTRQDPLHDFELAQGLTLTSQAVDPVVLMYVHRLAKELEPPDNWQSFSFSDVAVRCLDQCDVATPPIDAVTSGLHQSYLNEIFRIATPSDAGGLEIDLTPIPLPGFVPYHRDIETPHLSLLRTLITRAADFYYAASPGPARKVHADEAPTNARVRLCVGSAKTSRDALDALAWVLAQSSVPIAPLMTTKGPAVGDAAFEGPRAGAIYFVRRNVMGWLKSVGPEPAALLPLATSVDEVLRRRLQPGGRPQPSAE